MCPRGGRDRVCASDLLWFLALPPLPSRLGCRRRRGRSYRRGCLAVDPAPRHALRSRILLRRYRHSGLYSGWRYRLALGRVPRDGRRVDLVASVMIVGLFDRRRRWRCHSALELLARHDLDPMRVEVLARIVIEGVAVELAVVAAPASWPHFPNI